MIDVRRASATRDPSSLRDVLFPIASATSPTSDTPSPLRRQPFAYSLCLTALQQLRETKRLFLNDLMDMAALIQRRKGGDTSGRRRPAPQGGGRERVCDGAD
ncbi:hypothetical protein STCU_11480 [Strigomonas culicis]|uniref:Uncharacterized protein n=1 Tax=Strigomonas culicis TaxID=28005 RepID=S9V0A4_9TRYP|nr:hypothetical protein STCU_11480 [Strigomonas culicis]|eukprot:EPY16200.1 hypothetical protein STCU_11480 [Strigomonas culicis]